MGTRVYVFYRVAEADLDAALEIVRRFQRPLRREGVEHEPLMRRPGLNDSEITLLEAYVLGEGRGSETALRGVAGGFASALARLKDGPAELKTLLRSERRTEVFVPIPESH